MKLQINKFLPISQKCTIDLSKKITLFVGKNNSGKTYLSQLIWAINNFDINEDRYFAFEHIQPIEFIKLEDVKNSNQELSIQIDEKQLGIISKNYTTYIEKQKANELFKKDMELDIEILFDIEDFKNRAISQNGIQGQNWQIQFNKRKNAYKFNITISFDNNFSTETKEKFPVAVINRYLEGVLIASMLSYNPVYMPSTRLFLPSFYKYIFAIEKEFKDDMLDNLEKLNKKNKNFFASSYTQATDELIKKLIFEIDKPKYPNEYLKELMLLIEGDISVDKSEKIAMADISYIHNSGQKLPMHLSSSMVNQLVTVYLYFKYWYEKDNNFLILDEPEMNLHPQKKIKLLELLLKYASNNKLLIATHSSTFVKALINYIHLFDLKVKDSNTHAFINENNLEMDTNINLSSNDVAIYYFNGKTIVSYKKDDDSHIHFGTFTDIEKLQTKQYSYILDRLENDA